jgi:pseudaminic acid synthase
MQPKEFSEMVHRIRSVEESLGSVTYELSEKMKKNRKFSRSLFAVKDIHVGDSFTNDNVRSIRPADGISPRLLPKLLGLRARRKIMYGNPILPEDLQQD